MMMNSSLDNSKESIMDYIILDLEWNQGAGEVTEKNLPFEIVEIGAIKLNSRREKIGDRKSTRLNSSHMA